MCKCASEKCGLPLLGSFAVKPLLGSETLLCLRLGSPFKLLRCRSVPTVAEPKA